MVTLISFTLVNVIYIFVISYKNSHFVLNSIDRFNSIYCNSIKMNFCHKSDSLSAFSSVKPFVCFVCFVVPIPS